MSNDAIYYKKLREAYQVSIENCDPINAKDLGGILIEHAKLAISSLDEIDLEAIHKVMKGNFVGCTSRSIESLALLNLIRINYEEHSDGTISDKVKKCDRDIYAVLAYAQLFPERIKK